MEITSMNLYEFYQNQDGLNINLSADGRRATVKYVHTALDWADERIRMARGIVLDTATGEIVARPYEKFFNLGQVANGVERPEVAKLVTWQPEPFAVSEKMDGSLAIVYAYDGELHVGSTGNPDFVANGVLVADRLKAILSEQDYRRVADLAFAGYTLLFEYLNPEYVIVINYQEEAFKLHGMVHTATGRDFAPAELRGLKLSDNVLAPVYPELRNFDAVQGYLDNHQDIEGFVVRFKSGLRLKLKTEQYKALHKTFSLFQNNTQASRRLMLALYDLDVLDDLSADLLLHPDANKYQIAHLREFYDRVRLFDELVVDANYDLGHYDSVADYFKSTKDIDSDPIIDAIIGVHGDRADIQKLRYKFVVGVGISDEGYDNLDRDVTDLVGRELHVKREY